MPKLLKYLLPAVAGLIFSITVPAQNSLTRLQDDKAVKKGTLGCGITYYIIENPVVKGRADAMLVRRGEAACEKSRDDLAPFAGFLSRNGISPSAEGYILDRGASSAYSFPSVAVHETAVLDSTLLMIFTLAGKSQADEAIIISGDISAQTIKSKMDIFSLMLSRRNMGVRQDTHVWKSSPAPKWHFMERTGGNRSRISVSYSAPRVPQNRLYTSQAIVPVLFAAHFGPFVRRRIDRSFMQAGIPYADLDFSYWGTDASAGDEIYTLSMVTDTAYTVQALERLALVLGAIEDMGASAAEFNGIRASMRQELLERSTSPVSDKAWLERCSSHFLYGTNLAPEKVMVDFAVRRQLADSTWAGLFNNYNKAWLGRLENLNLDIVSGLDSLSEDKLIFQYNLGYLTGSVAGDSLSLGWEAPDSLVKEKEYPKVKFRGTRPEEVTGGETWYYSNGVKVIYKGMPSAQGLSYAVLWPGGMENIDDLKAGEGAHIAELFKLFDVSGINCRDFRDILAAGGISMEASLDLRHLVVRGKAPSDGLPLLMGSLLGITTEGVLNKDSFEAWRSGMSLVRDGHRQRLAAAMMPEYQCLPVPLSGAVSEDTYRKAKEFYEDRFSRMNEATIIIVGNADEAALRRLMNRCIGGFRVYGGTTMKRPVRYKAQDSHLTMHVSGGNCLHAVYHAGMPLSANNYFGAMVMQEWLSRALPQAMSRYGLSVDVRAYLEPWPREALVIEVLCRLIAEAGLPSGVTVPAPDEWAPLLDRAVRKLELPSAGALAVYKDRVSAEMSKVVGSPDGMVDMVLMRLKYGKNFVVNWSGNIASVDAARLRSMAGGIVGGGSIKMICQEETLTER